MRLTKVVRGVSGLDVVDCLAHHMGDIGLNEGDGFIVGPRAQLPAAKQCGFTAVGTATHLWHPSMLYVGRQSGVEQLF